jgi:hypothetical protein
MDNVQNCESEFCASAELSVHVRYREGSHGASKEQKGDQDLKILHSYYISNGWEKALVNSRVIIFTNTNITTIFPYLSTPI